MLASCYFVAGLVGRASTFPISDISLLWPPFGVSLGAILLLGQKFWPGIALGSLISAVTCTGTIGYDTAGTVVGSTMGAILCSYLLQRWGTFDPGFGRVRDVAGFVVLACLLGATATAAFEAAGECLGNALTGDELFSRTMALWVPSAMAGLIVAPVITTWGRWVREEWRWKTILEGVLCAGGLAGGTWVSFNSWYFYGVENYPFAYLPYPFLVWAALRFGARGATAGTLVVAVLAIMALLDGRGPFVLPSERESLMLIGSYLGVLATGNLLLASVAEERMTAERSVRESERRYRSVVDDQTELIWRFKDDGTLTFVNEAYCRFHGKTSCELIGSKYLPLLSDEDREIPLSYFATLTPDAPVVSYDYKLVLPSGEYVWQQCTTRRLFDESGAGIEFQSVALDVTRRKQTEEEVREAEVRLRSILNSMVDGVVVIDRQGQIQSFNRMAESVFGRTSTVVLNGRFRDLLVPESQPQYDEYLQRHLRHGAPKTMEAHALRPDGTKLPIDLAISEVRCGGQSLLVAVVRDITERKTMEEQFRQSQKMEAIGRLAGGIAHDFNNLIQAIIGYTNLLLRRLGTGDAPRETVEQIEKSAERAAALTSQLLAFSRKQVLKPCVLGVNSVVSDMTKLLQRLIGADIQLLTELADDAGCIRGDRGQVEQLILNLAINARDAMPSGGELKIRTQAVSLDRKSEGFSSDFQPGAYVQLDISDTGSGMTKEVMEHLFEPFFTTKDVGKGTGLGLSIVYGILKQNAGEVRVKSHVGRGTTFSLFLPRLDHVDDEESAVAPLPAQSGGNETILLVEDGEIVRAMLVEVLQEQGYQVLEAVDGEDALEVAARAPRKIDLVVTDLVMPKLGGRDLADRLGRRHPGLRVLFISGYSDDEVVRYGSIDGVIDFLQKPFRPEVLLSKVRSILDGQARPDPAPRRSP